VRDVMDYVNAEELVENQISTILYFTLQGLAYLHGLNPPIVHFDIKTNNLLLSNDGAVKV
jgi:serine/threonine protein kinase